jgi:hypothetical protein
MFSFYQHVKTYRSRAGEWFCLTAITEVQDSTNVYIRVVQMC